MCVCLFISVCIYVSATAGQWFTGQLYSLCKFTLFTCIFNANGSMCKVYRCLVQDSSKMFLSATSAIESMKQLV